MNNFELHELATTLSDTHTPYQLAKALIKSVQGEISLLDNGCGNDLDFNRNLGKRIKGALVYKEVPVSWMEG